MSSSAIVTVSAVSNNVVVLNNASALAAFMNPPWTSGSGFSRAGTPVTFNSTAEQTSGLVVVVGSLLNFSVTSASQYVINGQFVNASGYTSAGIHSSLTLHNYTFPQGALVGRIGAVLNNTAPYYFLLFPIGGSGQVVALASGPLFIGVWAAQQPANAYPSTLTVAIQYTPPLSALIADVWLYGRYQYWAADFPLYPAGTYGYYYSNVYPQWSNSLPSSLLGTQWSYTNVAAGTPVANFSISGSNLPSPSYPVPPLLLPWNRQPLPSTNAFGQPSAASSIQVSTTFTVQDPTVYSDPRSSCCSSQQQVTAYAIVQFGSGAAGEGVWYLPGLNSTGYVMDPSQAINSTVVMTASINASWPVYTLSWAPVTAASYYILPTADSYAGPTYTYLSDSNKADIALLTSDPNAQPFGEARSGCGWCRTPLSTSRHWQRVARPGA